MPAPAMHSSKPHFVRSKEKNGFFQRRGRLVKLLRRTQGPDAPTGIRIGGDYSKVGGERSGRAGRKRRVLGRLSRLVPLGTVAGATGAGDKARVPEEAARSVTVLVFFARLAARGRRRVRRRSPARPCSLEAKRAVHEGCTDRTRGSRPWRSPCCSCRSCRTCWSTAPAPAHPSGRPAGTGRGGRRGRCRARAVACEPSARRREHRHERVSRELRERSAAFVEPGRMRLVFRASRRKRTAHVSSPRRDSGGPRERCDGR